MPSGMLRRSNWWVIACAVIATGCAQPNATGADIDEDPLSGFNHAMYEFNHTFDGLILRPVTSVYRGVTPEKGREMVSNVIQNLYAPVVFANSVLQLDQQNSFATFWRFIINTTFGIGGLFDVASEIPLKNRPADFGQTLAIYGAEPGAYVVLPIVGPSNVRDSIGLLADAFLNPFNYIGTGESIAMWSATAVDKRSNNMELIDDIYNNSLDPYTTFRSGYTQKRASDIRRAKAARDKVVGKTSVQ